MCLKFLHVIPSKLRETGSLANKKRQVESTVINEPTIVVILVHELNRMLSTIQLAAVSGVSPTSIQRIRNIKKFIFAKLF